MTEEPEFNAVLIDLSDLAEAISVLDDAERLIAVDAWSRLDEGIGRGSSGWITHFVAQRTGELIGDRFVELGPVTMLRPVEVQSLAGECQALCRAEIADVHTTPALSRYWGEVGFLFSEKAIRPGDQAT